MRHDLIALAGEIVEARVPLVEIIARNMKIAMDKRIPIA